MRVPFLMAVAAISAACPVAQAGQQKQMRPADKPPDRVELSDNDKQLIRLRIDRMLEKDQQFRSYLSFGTTDDAKIKRVKKLGMKGQLQAMSANRDKLPAEIKKLLQQFQQKNDLENATEFQEIVRKYGYPSPSRIGVKNDRLFVLLLHPPVSREKIESHIVSMSELLLPEVRAGRMEPRMYATFIDNMRGKILRRPQLYGTNQQFDRKTGKVLPPAVASVKETNLARREIGMPELKEGEYRLVTRK